MYLHQNRVPLTVYGELPGRECAGRWNGLRERVFPRSRVRAKNTLAALEHRQAWEFNASHYHQETPKHLTPIFSKHRDLLMLLMS